MWYLDTRQSYVERRENGVYTFELDIPGRTKEDVSLTLTGRTLYLKVQEKGRYRQESYQFPVESSSQVSAKVVDGVLTVEIRPPESVVIPVE